MMDNHKRIILIGSSVSTVFYNIFKAMWCSTCTKCKFFYSLACQMAKVYPCIPCSSSSSTSSSEREMYTIWMKSLVINGKGYTVYDSNGKVVYRIENYNSKCCNEVFLMDLHGKVLCTILRKRFLRSGLWDGYKRDGPKVKGEKPWFQVRKDSKLLGKDSMFHVTMGFGEAQSSFYKINGSIGKSDFQITDNEGRVAVEMSIPKSQI